jgi:hypothetical protein
VDLSAARVAGCTYESLLLQLAIIVRITAEASLGQRELLVLLREGCMTSQTAAGEAEILASDELA